MTDLVLPHYSQVAEYMPTQFYSNRPSATHEPTEPVKDASTALGTPAPDAPPKAASAGLPVPPPEFRSPTAGPSARQGESQAAAAANDEGNLRIKLGGISSSKYTQEEEEITLSRFAAVRLGASIRTDRAVPCLLKIRPGQTLVSRASPATCSTPAASSARSPGCLERRVRR